MVFHGPPLLMPSTAGSTDALLDSVRRPLSCFIGELPPSARQIALVEVMGRYSNQGEMASQLGELVQMTPEPGPVVHRRAKQVHHRLRPSEIEQLITDYQSGVLVRQLAVRYGINRDTVIEHVRRNGGVRHRYPALLPKEIVEAAQFYRSGQSLATVGKHFGINASTVRSALLRAGVQMRDCQG